MKSIQLTKGQVAIVDDWNYDWYNQWKWQAHWNKTTQSYYATRHDNNDPSRKMLHMHREIMKTPDEMYCDHKNHNTLNNLEGNLRNVTHSQSGMNRRLRSDNKLHEKNISPSGKKFQVEFRINRKIVFCKRFKTIEEAKIIRDEKIRELHGEYASLGDL